MIKCGIDENVTQAFADLMRQLEFEGDKVELKSINMFSHDNLAYVCAIIER